MKICFASHNANKVKELNQLTGSAYEIIGLSDLGVNKDIPETGKTFAENATIKARYVYEKFKMPVFADDSGLMITALNDAPGIYSARYAGEDKDDGANMEKVLAELQDTQDRSAKFVTVISYINTSGECTIFEGEIAGRILDEKKGANGFGYDPIFVPEGYTRTFAELPADEKNKISHRAKAVSKLLDFLKTKEK